MRLLISVLLLMGVGIGSPARAAEVQPKLVVAVAVDQFSADLFAQYRSRFTGGFARLLAGAVFPSGYQSHASTETCPGHATILTGARPARAGIIANVWFDPRLKGDDKSVYCVEDENAPGSAQVISPVHLRTPTLGDRLKAARPGSRVVAVAGKDRSAVAMAGHNADEIWWWNRGQFASYSNAKVPAAVAAANARLKKALEAPRAPFVLPDSCRANDVAVEVEPTLIVGQGRLGRAAGEMLRFQASPDADQAVLDLALALAKDLKLGQGAGTDVLALGLSATDYVGHTAGNKGAEMCIQLLALDRLLAEFFVALDESKVDYLIVLTADHGGPDVPERDRTHGAQDARRSDGTLGVAKVGPMIAKDMGLTGPVLYSEPYGVGDFWIAAELSPGERAEVLKRALAFYANHPDVAAAFSREQILAAKVPNTPPDEWSPLERVRASFDPERSGDFYVVLKPRISPVEAKSRPYTAAHGSPWDYDRRVPIVFWRKGMAGFEQPLAVETVDIMPTLAVLIGLPVPAAEIDGKCLFGCGAVN